MSTCKCLLTDFASVGHVISKTYVFDELECHLKYMGNSCCKSYNFHPNDNDGKLICEQNKKSRQMKPDNFKQKKGSTYFSSIQVSGKLKV